MGALALWYTADMNIFSGSRDGDGLAASLTNPTEISRRKGTITQAFPLRFRDHQWVDAEEAFLTLCKGLTVDAADQLMIGIIAAKFQQYPQLAQAVADRGGVLFLKSCRHITGAQSVSFRLWEGFGLQSRFIRNLVAGFEQYTVQSRQGPQEVQEGPLNARRIPEVPPHV